MLGGIKEFSNLIFKDNTFPFWKQWWTAVGVGCNAATAHWFTAPKRAAAARSAPEIQTTG